MGDPKLTKLNQPTFKSKYLHNSYRYITSGLWNNLSDNIRGASCLRIFKNLLNNVNLTTEANSFYVDFHTKCENPHIAIVQFSRLGRHFP